MRWVGWEAREWVDCQVVFDVHSWSRSRKTRISRIFAIFYFYFSLLYQLFPSHPTLVCAGKRQYWKCSVREQFNQQACLVAQSEPWSIPFAAIGCIKLWLQHPWPWGRNNDKATERWVGGQECHDSSCGIERLAPLCLRNLHDILQKLHRFLSQECNTLRLRCWRRKFGLAIVFHVK